MNGLSIYICIGKWGGLGVMWDNGLRIGLGFIGIGILTLDIERGAEELNKLLAKSCSEIQRLKGEQEANHG